MYDPLVDMVSERQMKMRQEAQTHHLLASLGSSKPGLRQRAFYNLGGMLISFGTRMRESVPEPCDPPVPAASYGMPEGC
jgi:hypothetical protein